MRARVANYADLAELVKLARRHHELNDWNFLPFSSQKVRNKLVTMMRSPGTDVLVAEDEDRKLQGMLLAGLYQFFMNQQLYASDVHFVADKGGVELLRLFFKWAEERRAQMCFMTIATADTEERVRGFYEACGMERIGMIYVKRFHVEPQEQVA